MGGLREVGGGRPAPCWPVRRDWRQGPPFQQDASRQNQCAEKCSFSAARGGKSLPSSTKLVLESCAGCLASQIRRVNRGARQRVQSEGTSDWPEEAQVGPPEGRPSGL